MTQQGYLKPLLELYIFTKMLTYNLNIPIIKCLNTFIINQTLCLRGLIDITDLFRRYFVFFIRCSNPYREQESPDVEQCVTDCCHVSNEVLLTGNTISLHLDENAVSYSSLYGKLSN